MEQVVVVPGFAAGGGDVVAAVLADDPELGVTEGCQVGGAAGGADLGRVLTQGKVADPVDLVLKMSSRLRLWDVVRELLGEAWVNAGLPAARFLEPAVQLAGLRGRGEDYPAVRGPGLLAARDVSLA